MLTEVLRNDTVEKVKDALLSYINNAEEPQAWQNANNNDVLAFSMATKRLRHDIKMYDWICKEENTYKECFRVYWHEGHIMFAIPRKWWARIALDTERCQMAHDLCDAYGFEFDDPNQKKMYEEYQDCFGNEVWIKQKRTDSCVWVGFIQHHKLVVQIQCYTTEMANKLLGVFDNSKIKDNDEKFVQLQYMSHYTKKNTFGKLCQVIESIFENIPELTE